jgi:hypothetical protein
MVTMNLAIVELVTKLCWGTKMDWVDVRANCDLMRQGRFSEIPEAARRTMIDCMEQIAREPRNGYAERRAELRELLLCQPRREAC